MEAPTPAGWHADPFGRFERRYWDGTQWTAHVVTGGSQGIDPPVDTSAARILAGGLHPPGWYPDPVGVAGRRYWNGTHWTGHIEPGTGQVIDSPGIAVAEAPAGRPRKTVARQARKAGVDADHRGGGTLFTEQVLIVNQNARIVGAKVGYTIYDQHGHQLGAIEEGRRAYGGPWISVNLGGAKESRRRIHRFRVVDMNGRVLLEMTRPPRGWFETKATLVIEGPGAVPIGQIVHESFGLGGSVASAAHAGITNASTIAMVALGGLKGIVAGAALGGVQDRLDSIVEGLDRIGHARFRLEAEGQRLGSIRAEGTGQWDFSVQDPAGTEVARVTKTWAGWAKERFTKADHYVVEMHRPLEEPLRSLVLAAALAIDYELKESGSQTRGSSISGTRRYK